MHYDSIGINFLRLNVIINATFFPVENFAFRYMG